MLEKSTNSSRASFLNGRDGRLRVGDAGQFDDDPVRARLKLNHGFGHAQTVDTILDDSASRFHVTRTDLVGGQVSREEDTQTTLQVKARMNIDRESRFLPYHRR